MPIFLYIIFASLLVSLGSLIGIFAFATKKELSKKVLLALVSLSAGTLMGGAFFHLVPEALKYLSIETTFLLVVISFITFFLIEKILHWHHCHKENCEIHTFGYMTLVGDSVHNFIDGLIIASTFLIDIKLGMMSTLVIALHEIPQEIGDFGVLLFSGFKKAKAIMLNFLVALMALLGAIVGFFVASLVENLTFYLLPIAAGGFLYISNSDLIPEIRKEINVKSSSVSFFLFLIGLSIMYLIKFI